MIQEYVNVTGPSQNAFENMGADGGQGKVNSQKPVSESKATELLTKCVDDRALFRDSHEKLVNVISQVNTGSRHVLKYVSSKLEANFRLITTRT